MGTTAPPPQQSSAAAQRKAGLTGRQSWYAMAKTGESMTHIAQVTRTGIAPEVTRPAPDRVIAGDPVHTSWNIEDRDGLYCGLWQSTPGIWRVSYSEWEYIHILEGHSILTEADGPVTTLRAGDSLIIRPGFEGIWEVVETTLKDYVIRS